MKKCTWCGEEGRNGRLDERGRECHLCMLGRTPLSFWTDRDEIIKEDNKVFRKKERLRWKEIYEGRMKMTKLIGIGLKEKEKGFDGNENEKKYKKNIIFKNKGGGSTLPTSTSTSTYYNNNNYNNNKNNYNYFKIKKIDGVGRNEDIDRNSEGEGRTPPSNLLGSPVDKVEEGGAGFTPPPTPPMVVEVEREAPSDLVKNRVEDDDDDGTVEVKVNNKIIENKNNFKNNINENNNNKNEIENNDKNFINKINNKIFKSGVENAPPEPIQPIETRKEEEERQRTEEENLGRRTEEEGKIQVEEEQKQVEEEEKQEEVIDQEVRKEVGVVEDEIGGGAGTLPPQSEGKGGRAASLPPEISQNEEKGGRVVELPPVVVTPEEVKGGRVDLPPPEEDPEIKRLEIRINELKKKIEEDKKKTEEKEEEKGVELKTPPSLTPRVECEAPLVEIIGVESKAPPLKLGEEYDAPPSTTPGVESKTPPLETDREEWIPLLLKIKWGEYHTPSPKGQAGRMMDQIKEWLMWLLWKWKGDIDVIVNVEIDRFVIGLFEWWKSRLKSKLLVILRSNFVWWKVRLKLI